MLALEGVGKRYGALEALTQVSFEVPEGEVTGIIGPNGAGKTTLFNAVTGVSSLSEGRILLHGQDISSLAPHQICQLGIARTFQEAHLFPELNVLENVIVGRYSQSQSSLLSRALFLPYERRENALSVRTAEALLERVGISSHRNAMPSSLPYGDRRRLEVARALATEPTILLLDEPMAGMSGSEATELGQLILQLKDDGMTVVLIEHNVKLVMSLCQKVVALNFGRVLAQGPPGAVRKDANVVESYLGVD